MWKFFYRWLIPRLRGHTPMIKTYLSDILRYKLIRGTAWLYVQASRFLDTEGYGNTQHFENHVTTVDQKLP